MSLCGGIAYLCVHLFRVVLSLVAIVLFFSDCLAFQQEMLIVSLNRDSGPGA